ncbi:MAG: DEAD/DEAH box helicase family protein [Gemmatimonas sp.]|nr:DEAD/DEAH box helicase family protein [Gemmatimonas sp.]
MRTLEYQQRVLTAFDFYLEALKTEKGRADRIRELALQQPELGLAVPDFAERTWSALKELGRLPASRAAVPYSPRRDGTGRSVPNTVLKVPTAGGKTFLAVSAVSRIFGNFLQTNTGLVVWIVPNEAIFSQTWRHFNDRGHPYRQLLDNQGAGRVKILRKDDPLDARDIESCLCVLILMIQSARRTNTEFLRVFRDRGDVRGFFPSEGDQEAHEKLATEIPNLDRYTTDRESRSFWPLIKDSLGNALRVTRPVIVMDEGHLATSELSYSTLYDLNPCFVLELTATPRDVSAVAGRTPRPARFANVLCEVRGADLAREGMIKMPVNVDCRQGTDWRSTLQVALNRLDGLHHAAMSNFADTGRYIRPIMLVQVERTGDDQVDSGHIHSKHVADWLRVAGLGDHEIAIKTATTNDLASQENQDLLSPSNAVRVIITKEALREGWDCSFAYVLCSLASSTNLTGMTQLVGRILRQPHAEKVGESTLDECYVITHHADTAAVVNAVKAGLEADGLSDLVIAVEGRDPSDQPNGPRPIQRSERMREVEIFLPLVQIRDNGRLRALDYESDLLFAVEWAGVDFSALVATIPENARPVERQITRLRLVESDEDPIVVDETSAEPELHSFDLPYMVRMLADVVPNPWVAARLIQDVLAALEARGFSTTRIASMSGLLLEELRRMLNTERDSRAEALFRRGVADGTIQFRLRASGENWRMPHQTITYQPEGSRQLLDQGGASLKRNLFAPVYENDFSSADERSVAVYLDGEVALNWWHRNVAKVQYALQGWRRERVYPDFIFALSRTEGPAKIAVVEMKGDHLAGNDDTQYKKRLLQVLSDSFEWDNATTSGTLEIVDVAEQVVQCELVLLADWQTALPRLLL